MSEEEASSPLTPTVNTGDKGGENIQPESVIRQSETPEEKDPVIAKQVKFGMNRSLLAGIFATGLLIVSVGSAFFDHFMITPFAAGLALFGMLWYVSIRRRSSPDGVIFYSHSQILYYWPIWVGAFVISDLTEVPGISTKVDIANAEIMFAPAQMALFHLIVVAVVVFFTSVNIRGVWAVVFAVTLLALGLTFSVFNWWSEVFQYLGGLSLHADQGFYRVMGVVIFVPWLLVVFVFDIRRFFHFMPAQITMVNEIGEGEKNFDSIGVVMEKKRDNFMQHMALGFGSGDIIITPKVADREVITFPNVLRINSVLDQIQEIREQRGRNVL
ncbi:MAG: hypothetical protein VCA55_13705 [Verrucomicrobiales bacterium]